MNVYMFKLTLYITTNQGCDYFVGVNLLDLDGLHSKSNLELSTISITILRLTKQYTTVVFKRILKP